MTTEKEALLKAMREMERSLQGDLRTQSGFEVKEVYGPEDISHIDSERDIGRPGEYPFTRGTYPRMYREKLWVRGVEPGGIAYTKDIDKALDQLIETGVIASGIRTGGDYTDLACIDPDHPLAKYDLGRGGVYPAYCISQGRRLARLRRMLEEGTVVEIAHACGPGDVMCYARFVAGLEEAGMDLSKLRGSSVTDPLHTHITRSMNWNQPLDISFKLAIDMMEYSLKHTPRFRPTNAGCGYDLREAGIDTIQELAFCLASRIEYVDALLERGIRFDEIGHKFPLALSGEIDFFETICKLRAIRRMWTRISEERYGADPETMRCPPCNTNLAGSSMTTQQPVFNIVRNTIEAAASILGGVSGLDLKGYNEARTAPSLEASAVNKGIESIIAQETGIPLTADPLAGSYYVEWLTDKIEKEATTYLQKILDMGGMRAAIRNGWVQAEVERAAQERQRELEEGRRIKVCVNAYESLNEYEIKLPGITLPEVDLDTGLTETQERWLKEVREFKQKRDITRTKEALENLHEAAKEGGNIIRPMIDAYKAEATVGEIMGVIREAMGYTYDPFNMITRPEFLTYDVDQASLRVWEIGMAY